MPIVCCGYLSVVLTLSIIHKHQKYKVAHEIMDLVDADGDGQITTEEFVSAGSRQPNKQNEMQNREQGMQTSRPEGKGCRRTEECVKQTEKERNRYR